MARVQGVKEKLHSPLYDAFFVEDQQTFETVMNKQDPRVIRFFVDVQNKTRLETNLQAAGVLPSLNNFEARALRIVVSNPQCYPEYEQVYGEMDTFYTRYKNARATDKSGSAKANAESSDDYRKDWNALMNNMCSCSSAHTSAIIAELIYNSVTTLLVGEKTMIEMPTYFFPSGAGISPGNGSVINHGEPDPMATFRFSEPVLIEPQQNFRVEMLFPRKVPATLAQAKGPLRLWAVLDGYLTRDVQ